jgi:prevent-host-death family protein
MEVSMETVGAYEAKTHLTELLKRVAKGERITITKHGIPVATLQPADSAKKGPVREVIDQLKRFRGGHRLDGQSIREMIEEGRR